jgi:hypothetical protein
MFYQFNPKAKTLAWWNLATDGNDRFNSAYNGTGSLTYQSGGGPYGAGALDGAQQWVAPAAFNTVASNKDLIVDFWYITDALPGGGGDTIFLINGLGDTWIQLMNGYMRTSINGNLVGNTTGGSIVANKWQRITWVLNNGGYKIYIDRTLSYSDGTTDASMGSISSFYCGTYSGANQRKARIIVVNSTNLADLP